jgi:hypothetical protein
VAYVGLCFVSKVDRPTLKVGVVLAIVNFFSLKQAYAMH